MLRGRWMVIAFDGLPPVPGKFATNFPKVWYLKA
jgi:hypothetical protein